MAFRVTGTEKLERLATVLADHADGKALKNKLRKGIRAETGDITKDQRASLAAGLPKRGGAAATISGESKFSTRTGLVATRGVSVDIVDSWKGHDMPAIDAGTLRHPLFGHRKHWFDTRIKGRLLTRPFLQHRRGIERRIIVGLDELAAEIARET
jgi:hypothetical protein